MYNWEKRKELTTIISQIAQTSNLLGANRWCIMSWTCFPNVLRAYTLIWGFRCFRYLCIIWDTYAAFENVEILVVHVRWIKLYSLLEDEMSQYKCIYIYVIPLPLRQCVLHSFCLSSNWLPLIVSTRLPHTHCVFHWFCFTSNWLPQIVSPDYLRNFHGYSGGNLSWKVQKYTTTKSMSFFVKFMFVVFPFPMQMC